MTPQEADKAYALLRKDPAVTNISRDYRTDYRTYVVSWQDIVLQSHFSYQSFALFEQTLVRTRKEREAVLGGAFYKGPIIPTGWLEVEHQRPLPEPPVDTTKRCGVCGKVLLPQRPFFVTTTTRYGGEHAPACWVDPPEFRCVSCHKALETEVFTLRQYLTRSGKRPPERNAATRDLEHTIRQYKQRGQAPAPVTNPVALFHWPAPHPKSDFLSEMYGNFPFDPEEESRG